MLAIAVSLRLSEQEIQQLLAMVVIAEMKSRLALQRIGTEAPLYAKIPLSVFESLELELFDALLWLLDTGQSISVVCSKFGFATHQRRRLVLLVVDYNRRVTAALESLMEIARQGHDRRLRNSFDQCPLSILSPSERMRLARNHLHVGRLKGGKQPTLKKLMKQFGLTVDEALAVTGRGKDKEFTK